jgi:hypothetical protein
VLEAHPGVLPRGAWRTRHVLAEHPAESPFVQFIGEKFTDMNYYAGAKGPVIADIMRHSDAEADR